MNTIQKSLLNTWHYKQVSKDDIKQNYDDLLKQERQQIKNMPQSPVDSRIVNFFDFIGNSQEDVKVFGVIAGYRFSFNPRYHQAMMTLLLRDVWGINLMNMKKFLSGHMWININLDLMCGNHNVDLGIGDCVLLKGKIQPYQGHIHNMYGFKLSLNIHTRLLAYGYPVINDLKNNKIPLMVHQPTNQCLIKSKGYSPLLKVGNEISKDDADMIRTKHLYVGWTAEKLLERFMTFGMRLPSFHNNPVMLIRDKKDYLHWINNITWKKHGKSGWHKLTTARKAKKHPHTTYQHLKHKLFPKFIQSYYYLIAHHSLYNHTTSRLSKWIL